MASLVDDLLASTEELEPPKSFWYWAALSAISAVVKDNIWIERGGDYYKLYPNIYVMFHAASGLKKGPPVSLAADLVKKVNNTKVIKGRSSIQGILKKLGTAETKPGGKVELTSTAFICSSELTSSIVEDKVAADILTDLYDRQYNENDWGSLLKMEEFRLNKPTITMLTATNESHSEDFFAKKDIEGGYFARTFIIHETEENTINSLVFPLRRPINRDYLVERLRKLSELRGAFIPLGNSDREMTIPGKLYHDWYMDFRGNIKKYKIQDDTGTLNRFGDSVLKVAMLLSLAQEPKLEISETAMCQAIKICETLVGNIRKTTAGKRGKSQYTFQKQLIIQELMEREPHEISRTQLLRKFGHHLDHDVVTKIMEEFDQASKVRTEARGNQILYCMTDVFFTELDDFLKGRNK